MKKLFSLLISFTVIALHAQTADDIVTKYSANLGSITAFNNIKTIKFTGTVTTQGMDLPLTIQIINNRAVRTDVEVTSMSTTIISAYKDGKGWQQNPFMGAQTPTAIEAGPQLNEVKNQSLLTPALMDYKTRGSQIELQGQEDVNGVKAFKIKLTNKDEPNPTVYFISSVDYSLIKTISSRDVQGQSVEVETWYSDAKDVNGAKINMTRVQKINGEEFQTIKFDNVDVNKPIDEKIFDMP